MRVIHISAEFNEEDSRARLLENLRLLKGRTTFDELDKLVEHLIRPIAGTTAACPGSPRSTPPTRRR